MVVQTQPIKWFRRKHHYRCTGIIWIVGLWWPKKPRKTKCLFSFVLVSNGSKKGTWLFRVKLQVSKYIYIMKLYTWIIHEFTHHIIDIHALYLNFKKSNTKTAMFYSQTPRYGAPGDKWIWFNRKIRRSNFETKLPDEMEGIEQTMMMYDVEMEQPTCGKMETSSILPLLQFAITSDLTTKDKISLRHLPKKLLHESGWRRRSLNILEDLQLSDGSKKLQHGEPWLNNCLGGDNGAILKVA